MTLVLLVLTNCDNDGPTTPSETGLVGTWDLVRLTIVTSSDTTTYGPDEITPWTLELKSDSTYVSTRMEGGSPDVETGPWSVSGDTFILGDQEAIYELEGDKLTITVEVPGITYIEEFNRQ